MVELLPFIISRRGLASQNFLNRPRRALSARAPQSSRYVPGVPFETVSVTSEAWGRLQMGAPLTVASDLGRSKPDLEEFVPA